MSEIGSAGARVGHAPLDFPTRESQREASSSFARALLDARHNISPRRLVSPGPTSDELGLLMEAAATAPDHGLLTPWHFVLVPTASRATLGEAFARALIERDPGATTAQLQAAAEKAARAPCLLLAVAHLGDSDTGIPANERLISLGCAIQNILLCATALGYGSGLSSGRSLDSNAIRATFKLAPSERAICFVALGSIDRPRPPRVRPPAGSLLHAFSA